jgi:hypothetical protein
MAPSTGERRVGHFHEHEPHGPRVLALHHERRIQLSHELLARRQQPIPIPCRFHALRPSNGG